MQANQPDKTAPPRIIYLLKMFPRFSETFILNELLGLEQLGYDIRIYSLKKPNDGKFHGELGRLKTRARYIPEYVMYALVDYAAAAWHVLKRKPMVFFSTLLEAVAALNPYAIKRWFQALWLTRELQQQPETLVHCHFALSSPRVAYFLKKLNGNPYTFTAHAKDIYLKNTKSWLLRRKIEHSDGVVTVCDYNRQFLLSRYAQGFAYKVERIYNGVNLAQFIPPPFEARSSNVILSVSRLVEKKGLTVLLDACGILAERNVEFCCRIAGEGPLSASLRAKVERLKLAERVQFLGAINQEQVRDELAKCAVLAAPSIEAHDGNLDALPTILLEALACGTPVVSTPVTGIPEIVTDGEQGLLVSPGDAKQLADALQKLLIDHELRKAMGEKGRRRAEQNFDQRKSIQLLSTFFQQARARAKALHVGYVLTVFPRLSETFVLREIRELEALGVRVTVYSQKPPIDAKVHEETADIRAKILYLSPWWRVGHRLLASHIFLLVAEPGRYIKTVRFLASRSNLPTAKKFWRAALVATHASSQNVQLFHSHFVSGNTRLARVASDLTGIPYSLTAHAKDIYAAGISDRKLARRLQGASFVATISQHNRDYLLSKAPKARVKLVPNSVRLDEFPFSCNGHSVESHPLRILAIGRLVAKKGFHVMLQATAQLRSCFTNVEVRIVGDGPEEPFLRNLVAEAGLVDMVRFTGAKTQRELRSEFHWADVLVVPSIPAPDGDIDGVPVVILEAMALGVPVIASRLSGIPEVVRDRETGTLVEPGNAKQLCDVLANWDRNYAHQLALNARRMVEQEYDIRRNCKRLLKYMKSAAGATE